jgi:hypothetical protein
MCHEVKDHVVSLTFLVWIGEQRKTEGKFECFVVTVTGKKLRELNNL